jgi:acetylornithine deacetylase
MPSTLEILDRLIAFDTTSSKSNIALVDYVRALLDEHRVSYETVPDETGGKIALVATVPDRDGRVAGGIAFSAHTDVVPTEGQPWTRPPYELTAENGRMFGRGTTDMKGFVAAALKTVLDASEADLERPLHLALSYDEEVGCKGIKPLIDHMQKSGRVPDMAIIGEPTLMQPVIEHKGKIALTCDVTGEPGHSSYAATKVNAVIEAARLINFIADLAKDIGALETPDARYVSPNSSLHVGPISGGEALNMIPEKCTFQFETRYRPGFDAGALMERIKRHAHDVLEPDMHARNENTGFAWSVLIDYPAFRSAEQSRALELVSRVSGRNDTGKVDYGTEAGVFAAHGGIDSVVIGPGSMAQGHQPDEFIDHEQLQEAESFLARVVDDLRHR